MTKREYLIVCIKQDKIITSYVMHKHFKGYCFRFYKDLSEKKAQRSFTYEVRKLIKERILGKPHRVGLGIGSKTECMSSTQQIYWHVLPYIDINTLK